MKKYSEIDKKYKWNTEDIFRTPEEFESTANTVVEVIDTIPFYKNKLGKKESLLKCFEKIYKCSRIIMKLGSYARRKRDTQMDVSEYQELCGLVESLSESFTTVSSFVEPELLSLPEEVLQKFAEDKDFSLYKRYLGEIIRNKPHTLSDSEEMLMARFSSLSNAQYETFSTFTSADMKFPEIKLSDGKKIEINQANYSIYRQTDNREDRKTVFDEFWETYHGCRNSISKMLHYQIKYYTTTAEIRKFKSSRDRAMHGNELPEEFFSTLKKQIRKQLPSLHDYLELKKEVLNIEELKYYDIYASMVPGGSGIKYPYEKSVELVSEAMSPMTKEYRETINRAMKTGSGWTDVYPSAKKRNGAYMSGEAYDIHPFVLLNHTDDYSSVSTLAHEMGHAMHSYYSNKFQPFETSQYSIFVAEVASVFNEIMLINHMLDTLDDGDEKRYLLNHFIEMIRTTVFRQMQFAEFEDSIYGKVEKGEVLSPDFLDKTYGETLRDYYGEEKGVMTIDSLYTAEWSFVPHFYYNYYVYQYVVGFVGALSLATDIRKGKISPEHYIDGFLKAGSSKPPLEILKDAGVDLSSPEPYELTGEVLRENIEQLKNILT